MIDGGELFPEAIIMMIILLDYWVLSDGFPGNC